MRKFNWFVVAVCVVTLVMLASVASAAYQHAGDADKDAKYFRDIYPGKVGTKLDNCTLCSGVTSNSGITRAATLRQRSTPTVWTISPTAGLLPP
jgi:hypothetical protein